VFHIYNNILSNGGWEGGPELANRLLAARRAVGISLFSSAAAFLPSTPKPEALETAHLSKVLGLSLFPVSSTTPTS